MAEDRDDNSSPSSAPPSARRLRSRAWFDNPNNPSMTALYVERYLNFALTREELQSGKPVIGGIDGPEAYHA